MHLGSNITHPNSIRTLINLEPMASTETAKAQIGPKCRPALLCCWVTDVQRKHQYYFCSNFSKAAGRPLPKSVHQISMILTRKPERNTTKLLFSLLNTHNKNSQKPFPPTKLSPTAHPKGLRLCQPTQDKWQAWNEGWKSRAHLNKGSKRF